MKNQKISHNSFFLGVLATGNYRSKFLRGSDELLSSLDPTSAPQCFISPAPPFPVVSHAGSLDLFLAPRDIDFKVPVLGS